MLIFFMIAGRLGPSDPLPAAPPVSAQGRAADDRIPRLIVAADGRMVLDGEIVSRAALGGRIRVGMAARPTPTASEDPALTLKADASLHAGALREILDLLRSAGIATVSLVTAQTDH